MTEITSPEIRELLNSIERIAVRPGNVTQKDLILAPALFAKLMNCRTGGMIQVKTMIDGKEINFEVVE
ncbi:hypothetical protein PQE61_001718 [Acinetobacter baumannii]|nr:hypothetical protein [Acinetobacter baumannii]